MDGSLSVSQTVLVKFSTLNLPLQQLVALSVLPASYFLMAKFRLGVPGLTHTGASPSSDAYLK